MCNAVKKCRTCQQSKSSQGLQQQWQELPAVSKPLERLGVDLTDMTSGIKGYRYVFTIIDHYSRYVKFYPLPNKTSDIVTDALTTFVHDFGTPRSIVLDNGGEFQGAAFQNFCRRNQIRLLHTTPYHPQGNGVVERMHRTLKSVLASLCNGYPLRWPQLIRQCQGVLNSAVHTSTGVTPFFAFFSRHPPCLETNSLPVIEGDEDDLSIAHQVIRNTHEKMARKFRSVANRGRINQAVKEQDLVWVKSVTPVPGSCRKLNLRWNGPYKVVEVIRGGSAYLLEHSRTGQRLQRAADQIKVVHGADEWVVGTFESVKETPNEEEPLPPRVRRAPRRFIEEC